MGEPASTTAAVVAGAAGVGFAGYLAGFDAWAAVGALFGALIYSTTTQEFPTWQRLLFLVASFVMGYVIAPGIREVEVYGYRPFQYTGIAAFVAALLVVTLSLWLIQRGKSGPGAVSRGGQDG
ncbi:putative holin [Pseudomonas citronellolis]|uniref:putative holin n=1 Tax=Pseudomonas TaxID=286 RepID=UPI00226EBD6B|nr:MULTISPECIES: putative holin [Pseudomonas]WAB92494.1 putative holin [Pseudomonas citronellolis]